MSTSASEIFASTPDLLHLLAHHTLSQTSLQQLCLVSRLFYDIFSPRLYEDLCIRLDDLRRVEFLDLSRPGRRRLPHVKALHIDTQHRDGSIDIEADRLAALLKHAAGVQSFCWRGSLMLTPFMTTLYEALPRLRSLVIHAGQGDVVPNTPEPASRDALRQSLSWRFSHLTSFSYRHAHGNPTRPPQAVLQICKTSPHLAHLSLSANELIIEGGGTVLLQNLCAQYQQVGGLPLKLESLHLGESMYLTAPTSALQLSSAADYLSMLTDLTRLERLRVCTEGNFLRIVQGAIRFHDVLQPAILPRLRSLGFSDLDAATLAFLRAGIDKDWVSTLDIAIDKHSSEDFGGQTNQYAMMLDLFVPQRPADYVLPPHGGGVGNHGARPRAASTDVASLAAREYLQPRSLMLPELRPSEGVYLRHLSPNVTALSAREGTAWGQDTIDRFRDMPQLESIWLSLTGMPRSQADLRKVVERLTAPGGRARLRYVRVEDWPDETLVCRVRYERDGEEEGKEEKAVLEVLGAQEDRAVRPAVFDWACRWWEDGEVPFRSRLERFGLA